MSKVSGQYGTGVELSLSWVKANNGSIPPKAVRAGGETFVARAKHEGQYIPGKLVQGYNEVFVSYGGVEHSKNYYEVLVESSIFGHKGYEWKWANGDNLPKGALVAGINDGSPLYVARSFIEDQMVVGKYFPQHGCGYMPYGGEEKRIENVEVLCCTTKHV